MTREDDNKYGMPILAEKVAMALGEDWSSAAGNYLDRDAFLIGPGGARILVANDGWRRSERGRIFLRGVTPQGLNEHAPRGDYRTTISVSATKTAAQIAREIQRRLLPSYHAFVAAARITKKNHDERDAQRATLGEELATLLGSKVTVHAVDGNLSVGEYFNGGIVTVPFDDDTVHFDLRFPQPLARQLAAVIGELRTKPSTS